MYYHSVVGFLLGLLAGLFHERMQRREDKLYRDYVDGGLDPAHIDGYRRRRLGL